MLTPIQAAIWALLTLISGQFDYVPIRGTIDVLSDDRRSMRIARSAVELRSDGRCVMFVRADSRGREDISDEVRLHELAHILDCLDNRALDGSPLPADADASIIPQTADCLRNASERFACWYVAQAEGAAVHGE